MDDRELRSLLRIGPISIGNFMDILGYVQYNIIVGYVRPKMSKLFVISSSISYGHLC